MPSGRDEQIKKKLNLISHICHYIWIFKHRFQFKIEDTQQFFWLLVAPC